MTRSMTITGGGGLLHIPRFHFITPVILNTVRPAGVRHPGHAIETDPLTELPDRAGHQTDITTAQAFIMEGIFTRLHRVTFLHRCITQRDNAAQVIRELITVSAFLAVSFPSGVRENVGGLPDDVILAANRRFRNTSFMNS